jgi:FkbM family methyltransferase
LFRQSQTGQWGDVVKRVLSALDQMHDRRALSAMLARAHFASGLAPVTDVTGAKVMLRPQIYEPDVTAVIEKVLRPGDTFIDVGANAGIHTVAAARIVGLKGKVIAFEPGENVLPELRENTKDLPQVRVIDRPLWNVPGSLTFFLNADNSGGNALWDPAEWPGPHNPKSKENPHPLTLEGTTLDIEWRLHPSVRSPRLVKIDTEGAEQRVLEGAVGILKHQKPDFIVAELHEFGLDRLGCSQASLRDFMLGHGYRMFVLAADGSRPRLLRPDRRIESPKGSLFVTNVLFSTEEAVNAAWPEAPTEADGVEVHGYRLQPLSAA